MTTRLEALRLALGAAVLAGLLVATPLVQPASGALAAGLAGETVQRAGGAGASCSSAHETGILDRHGTHVPPDYEECEGIRPGAQIESPTLCTLNFVFDVATNDSVYVGTAGHCVGVDDRVSTPGVGTFGTVVWTVENGIAEDYALIEVDEEHKSDVTASVCTWGGPTGLDGGDSVPGETLYEYGWGIATFASDETRSRAHVENLQTGAMVSWNGVGSGGDSGAPIVDGQGEALAAHVSGLTPLVGAASEIGAYLPHMLDLAADANFDDLEVRQGDTFHPATSS